MAASTAAWGGDASVAVVVAAEVVAEATLLKAESPPALVARTRNVYAVEGESPVAE
jgi:hypothetical protein